MDEPLLVPGETCWRKERAGRFSFVIDAAPYFAALREALPRAERSVYIVGWDVDSRTRLSPDDSPADGRPPTLLAFLDVLLRERPELHVYVLAWDYSFIYTFEREPLPRWQFSRVRQSRLHFALDDTHALGASHHQKIVVIDDRLAFTGGVDLTIRRWDTPEHRPDDPRRRDPAGVIASPMHDVQVAFDGPAAAAMGDLARDRWRTATGQNLRAPFARRRFRRTPRPGADPWPASVVPDAREVELAIARTAAAPREPAAHVREVERLTVGAIRAARRTIFIENQFLTATSVTEAIADRLSEPDGPEVLIVLPQVESGWLERGSLGVLRRRVLARLQAADRHGRLRVYRPVRRDGDAVVSIPVHSKVMVVDDRLVKVGSANISNRSMALDTECDVALDGARDVQGDALAACLRARLLGEHLGVAPDRVAEGLAASGSLLATVDGLRGGERSLEPLDDVPPPAVTLDAINDIICDPSEPISADAFIDRMVPLSYRRSAGRTLLKYAGAVALLVAFGLGARMAVGEQGAAIERLAELGRHLLDKPAGAALLLGGFILAGVAFVPITLLVTAALLTFGMRYGAPLAYVGALGAACASYGVGRALGTAGVRWALSRRVARVRRQLRRRGFVAVLLARLLPVGNFAIINLLAGALQVPFRSYVLGNMVGLLPGVLGLGMLTDRLLEVLRRPSAGNIALLAAVVLALGGLVVLLRRLLQRPRMPARMAEGHGQG
jgi:phosphatidylserine/phosphatidylglycerophosphate/cardiolipin synthase-like enzyme/uncharacterized membrane protein YdjX (TVP38/TMEM64 family)